MKKSIVGKIGPYITAALFPISFVQAQETDISLPNDTSISGVELKLEKNDSVYLSFTLKTSAQGLSNKDALIIRPAVQNAGQTLWLRPVRIASKYMQLNDRRKRVLAGNRTEPIELLVRAGDEVRYELSWPYKEWMEHLTLDVESYREGVRYKIFERSYATLIDQQQIYFPPIYVAPHVSEIPVPKHLIEQMAERNSFISASKESDAKEADVLAFNFRQGSAYLDLKLDQNADHMRIANNALKAIHDNPDVKLRKVRLWGYSSVEGSRAINEKISTARAEAVYKGIDAAVRPSRRDVEIISGGENWEDLTRQAEADPQVPQRNAVLEILRGEPDTEKRKVKLRALKEAYDYLLKNIFPRQRSAGYMQLFFDVIRRSDTNQQSAMRYNEAVKLIAAGCGDEALALLKNPGVKLPKADAANLWGVCLWQQGNREAAARYFRTALEIAPSHEDARRNLEALDEWDEHHILQPVIVGKAAEE